MFVTLSKMKERKLKLTKQIIYLVKADCVHVLSKQNIREKENHKKTLRDPPEGMECGHYVAHLLFIKIYYNAIKKNKYPFRPLKNGSKRVLQVLGEKRSEGGVRRMDCGCFKWPKTKIFGSTSLSFSSNLLKTSKQNSQKNVSS